MKIHDLSPEISQQMTVYKNIFENRPKIIVSRTIRQGSNESMLEIYSHTGSHVDAPYHFLQKGTTIEKMKLDRFIGNAIVLDFCKVKDSIKDYHLKNMKIMRNDIVLLKTKNKPDKVFRKNFTYLDKSGAKYLVSKKIKAIGIDSLSIERNQPNYETHKAFASADIPIFEGLDMSRVKQGRYFFYGLPLKIRKGDASPVRAILVEK